MGKTVECGSCDGRFKVDDEVLVKEKQKFYPGEKRGAHLERFASAKASAVSAAPEAVQVGFQQAHYQPDPHAELVGPPRPRRTVAAVLGGSLMVLILIVFLLAGGKEGPMRDMETQNRFILCGFTALLGCGLLFYGMVKNRMMGGLLCLLLGGGLMAMPVLFPGNPTSASDDYVPDLVAEKEAEDEAVAADDEADYMDEIGYEPVAESLRVAPAHSIVAIYLRNANKGVREKISDYLYEETGKLARGISYDRGDFRDSGLYGLILLQQQTKSIDEVAVLCSKFGRINKIYKNLRVVDVTVSNSKIVKLDPESSLDPSSSTYYREQLKALRGFDPEQIKKAVARLGGVEPKAHRDDISKELLRLLAEKKDKELRLALFKAISVWSQPGDGAGVVVLAAVNDLYKVGESSKIAMEFLIDRQVDGSQLVLMELWSKDPVEWSPLFLKLGEGAQVLLLPSLNQMDTVHVVAAADILGKVGSKACVPELEKAAEQQTEELSKNSLKAAIDEIEKRS